MQKSTCFEAGMVATYLMVSGDDTGTLFAETEIPESDKNNPARHVSPFLSSYTNAPNGFVCVDDIFDFNFDGEKSNSGQWMEIYNLTKQLTVVNIDTTFDVMGFSMQIKASGTSKPSTTKGSFIYKGVTYETFDFDLTRSICPKQIIVTMLKYLVKTSHVAWKEHLIRMICLTLVSIF